MIAHSKLLLAVGEVRKVGTYQSILFCLRWLGFIPAGTRQAPRVRSSRKVGPYLERGKGEVREHTDFLLAMRENREMRTN